LKDGEGPLDEDDESSWEPLKEGGGRYGTDQQEGYPCSSHDVLMEVPPPLAPSYFVVTPSPPVCPQVLTTPGWYDRYSGTAGGDKKLGSKTRKGFHDEIVDRICKDVGVYRKHKSVGTQITKMVGDFRQAHVIPSKTGAGEVEDPKAPGHFLSLHDQQLRACPYYDELLPVLAASHKIAPISTNEKGLDGATPTQEGADSEDSSPTFDYGPGLDFNDDPDNDDFHDDSDGAGVATTLQLGAATPTGEKRKRPPSTQKGLAREFAQ